MSSSNNSKNIQNNQDYWSIVKRQFNRNKLAVWSMRAVYMIVFVALIADFLASDLPLACGYNGKTYFPVLKEYGVNLGISKWPPELSNVDWHNLKYDWVVTTPIPYSPKYQDLNNANFVSPLASQNVPSFKYRHFLGTDNLGRDVLSGMIKGTRVAVMVGVISMSIAVVIGIILGAMAGYFGDTQLKMSRARVWLNVVFLFIAVYYAFVVRSYDLSDGFSAGLGAGFMQLFISLAIFFIVMLIPNLLTIGLKKIPYLKQQVAIPLDILISRLIEVKVSIPSLLLILSIVAVLSKPSILIVMVVIGFLGWTGIAKYIRAELLKVRSLEYIEAAQALGFSQMRVMFKHAIPNSLTPVLITIAFGVAGAILTESSLSYLGIGVAPEDVTWGSLLAACRQDVGAWWLAIIPGFAIFITITIFNLLGEGLAEAMDPRLKQ